MKRKYTMQYSMILFFYWMSFEAVMSFSSYYLLAKGFSNTQIGLVVAIAGSISAILQPVIASYADKPESPSLRNIELVIIGMIIILSVLLMMSGNILIFVGAIYAGLLIILQLQMPLVNALGTESMNQQMEINYGLSRAIGSLGYAVGAYLLGVATVRLGERVMPVSFILIYTGMFLALFWYPFKKMKKEIRQEQQRQTGGILSFFIKYKIITLFLLGCIFTYIGHVAINNFTLQIIQDKGGGSAEMGVAQALGSIFELPTLFLFAYMIKICKVKIWVGISSVFFFLKVFATLLAPNITLLYVTQVFQMLGWGLMVVACVYYINENMREEDTIKGQAYMTMTFTLATVTGCLACGRLIDRYSVHTMLIFASVCGFVGMMIIIISVVLNRKP